MMEAESGEIIVPKLHWLTSRMRTGMKCSCEKINFPFFFVFVETQRENRDLVLRGSDEEKLNHGLSGHTDNYRLLCGF